MIAYLVHGFNIKDGGAGTTDRLVPLLERRGYKPVEIDYGYFGLGRVRMCNHGASKILASIVEPGSIAIGHSNGCAILRDAARFGAKFQHVTLINPALDEDADFPFAASVNVWHSPTDVATLASRFLFRHPWGSMGRFGYSGDSLVFENYNEDVIFKDSVGHSGVFLRHRLERVLDELQARL